MIVNRMNSEAQSASREAAQANSQGRKTLDLAAHDLRSREAAKVPGPRDFRRSAASDDTTEGSQGLATLAIDLRRSAAEPVPWCAVKLGWKARTTGHSSRVTISIFLLAPDQDRLRIVRIERSVARREASFDATDYGPRWSSAFRRTARTA